MLFTTHCDNFEFINNFMCEEMQVNVSATMVIYIIT